MIESTAAYREAIVGDARRILVSALIDIIDPDIVYGTVDSSGVLPECSPEQVHDKIFDIAPYATLELDRWVLDGTFDLFPMDGNGNVGFVGDALCGADGVFSPAVWVEEQFSGVSILQACSVYFPDAEWDGYPVDFTVEVKQGGTAYFTQTFTGNTASEISLSGFTVYDPDAIRVTVTKWSLPYRRLRVAEILPGIYEEWDEHIIAGLKIEHQGNVSCMALPYGTCIITMENLDRRFEPRNKSGVFSSITERQGIDVKLGVRLADGTDEYKRIGIFYQYSGGWKTGDNGLTMQWDLVDIIGLLADREFIPPDTLPSTLGGWAAALVAQLGVNFADCYTVDPNYAALPLSVATLNDVQGMKCGDLLRYICMATGTWPRADAETGHLAIEPLWSQGATITLDNLESYPTIRANDDVAAIIFTLNDGNDTKCVISGNSTSSSSTLSVQNPFIRTAEQAAASARVILSAYGGNRYEIVGRGDMSSEIGDVDTIWLNGSAATTARRVMQNLSFSNGVLQGCGSTLLQADGSFLYQNRAVITDDGVWIAPAGVSSLRVILVGGGSGGANGTDGSWSSAGEKGADGQGGLVWAGSINIDESQTFDVTIGRGGAAGQPGGATVFGAYSSANGVNFDPNYTDIASGDAFTRDGVTAPATSTGDGGSGGAAGRKGNRHTETKTDSEGNSSSRTVIDNYPGPGGTGVTGADGCVVIYWDKESADG